MSAPSSSMADEIHRLVTELPRSLVESLASAIRWLPHFERRSAEAAIYSAVPQPHYRALARSLLKEWETHDPEVGPAAMAFALVVAARCGELANKSQRTELVWTGPEVEAIPPRRTEQALLQVIDSAQTTLTIVSFVAYKVPRVAQAIAAAVHRGVAVRLILEDPEVSQGKVAFAALNALDPGVPARCKVYVWPVEKRPKDGNGKHGSLHAKCAIADGHRLLVSSANLTEHALTVNLELGILLTGGPAPATAEEIFSSMTRSGDLTLVAV
jgi:phosphatidylserine/phosphatidylglycerophosphate/cardiolipin synthase-like enzyme